MSLKLFLSIKLPQLLLKIRDDVLNKFRNGELTIVVATSGFGMGIDVANVRLVAFVTLCYQSIDLYYTFRAVVHHKFALTLDDYVQQMGRKLLFLLHLYAARWVCAF